MMSVSLMNGMTVVQGNGLTTKTRGVAGSGTMGCLFFAALTHRGFLCWEVAQLQWFYQIKQTSHLNSPLQQEDWWHHSSHVLGLTLTLNPSCCGRTKPSGGNGSFKVIALSHFGNMSLVIVSPWPKVVPTLPLLHLTEQSLKSLKCQWVTAHNEFYCAFCSELKSAFQWLLRVNKSGIKIQFLVHDCVLSDHLSWTMELKSKCHSSIKWNEDSFHESSRWQHVIAQWWWSKQGMLCSLSHPKFHLWQDATEPFCSLCGWIPLLQELWFHFDFTGPFLSSLIMIHQPHRATTGTLRDSSYQQSEMQPWITGGWSWGMESSWPVNWIGHLHVVGRVVFRFHFLGDAKENKKSLWSPRKLLREFVPHNNGRSAFC